MEIRKLLITTKFRNERMRAGKNSETKTDIKSSKKEKSS